MYILHLSDLHFGTKQDADRWSGQLTDDLRGLLSQLEPNQSPHLDALIVSGDIANKSLPEEYEAAERFINCLLPEFGLQRHQMAIVPGNHDLNWKLSEQAYEIQKLKAYEGSLDEEDILNNDIIVDGNYVHVPNQQQYEERFKHFSKFYENVIGRPYPRQYSQQYELLHCPEQKLLILGLNSAWKLNHDQHYRSRANINPDALNNALGEINHTPTYRDSKLKIAVWHHPLNSSYEDRIKDHGFMERLAKNGFRLALHGHIHRANAGDYNYSLSKRINIIAAGTFGAPVKEWVPGYPLQYNLLKWQDNILTVYTRKRIELNGAWKPDTMWLQDGLTASSFYQIKLWDSEDSEKTPNDERNQEDNTTEVSKPEAKNKRGQTKVKTTPGTKDKTPKSEELEDHYKSVIKAIIRGRFVPFLGSDINLCDRPIQDNRQIEPWDPDGPYPPSGKELAEYLAQTFPLKVKTIIYQGKQETETNTGELPEEDLSINKVIHERAILIYPDSKGEGILHVGGDPLQYLSQYVYLTQEGELYDQLCKLGDRPNQLHKFFAKLPRIMREKGYYPPYPLIVTTNYDRALEQAFEDAKQPFDLVFYSNAIEPEKPDMFVHRKQDGTLHKIREPNKYEGLSFNERPVILKLYGTSDQIREIEGESVVITEEHYIEYLVTRDLSSLLPPKLLKRLRAQQPNMLFLGYPLGNWNQRIILHRIWQNLTSTKRYIWWAIQPNPEPLAQKLWKSYNVVLHNVILKDYLTELEQKVRDIPPKGDKGYE